MIEIETNKIEEVYDFGLRLAELRKKRKLSQTDVARKLDMSKASISAYECNIAMPSVETLKSLAIIYRSSVDYMLGLDKLPVLCIDDLSSNQQEFILDMIRQVRERFMEK